MILGIKLLQNVFGLRHNETNVTRGFWTALNIIGPHIMFGLRDWVLLSLLYLLPSLCLLLPLPLLLFTAICQLI